MQKFLFFFLLICLLTSSFSLALTPIIKGQTTYLKTFEKGDTYIKIPEITVNDGVITFEETKDYYQFNITISKPPISNIFNFPIETKGLEFYYQPPLNEWVNVKDYTFVNSTHAINDTETKIIRPENITHSYAVYKSKRDLTGTGKLYHIYRPLLIDAKGVTSWANLTMTKTDMAIICDSDFLANAAYPVIIDPIFGYDTIGGTGINDGWPNSFIMCKQTAPANGNITNIGFHTHWGSYPTVGKAVVMSDNSGVPNAVLYAGANATITDGWNDFPASYVMTALTVYWIGVYLLANQWGYGDAGDANQTYVWAQGTYPTVPSPYSPTFGPTISALEASIYANYTASGVDESFVLPQTIALTSALYTQKTLYKTNSQTVTVTSSLTSLKTLTKTLDGTTVTTSIFQSSKSILAVTTEILETATLTATLQVTKAITIILGENIVITAVLTVSWHISAVIVELIESFNVSAVLTTILPVAELTAVDAAVFAVLFAIVVLGVCIALIYSKKVM